MRIFLCVTLLGLIRPCLAPIGQINFSSDDRSNNEIHYQLIKNSLPLSLSRRRREIPTNHEKLIRLRSNRPGRDGIVWVMLNYNFCLFHHKFVQWENIFRRRWESFTPRLAFKCINPRKSSSILSSAGEKESWRVKA